MAEKSTTERSTKKTKLDIVHNSAELVALVQKECRVWIYDQKKVISRLNCNGSQARTLIALAQIEDARGVKAKAAA